MKCIVTIQTKRWKRRGHCLQKKVLLAEIIGLWNIIISYRETQKNMKNFSMKIKYLAFVCQRIEFFSMSVYIINHNIGKK